MQSDGASNTSEAGETPEVKFCKNCKRDIAAANFTIHEVHCERNITLCTHCDEPVGKNDLDRHIADQHTQVPCPHCSQLMVSSKVDQHVADVHATVECSECGENVAKSLLEDHKRLMHSTTTCQLCRLVVDKADFVQHQKRDCTKRQELCQYCDMMVVHSEHEKHENYCGSRTEPCAICGRYIMVREADVHQQTNCQYPPFLPKDDNGSSGAEAAGFPLLDGHRFDDRFEEFFARHTPPFHMQDMFAGHHRHLEDDFGRMRFPPPHARTGDRFNGDNAGLFMDDDAPPPYHRGNDVNEDAHANDRHPVMEARDEMFEELEHVSISSDDDNDDDDDDDDVTLPCEFCKNLYVAKKLLKHQRACQLSYMGQNDDGDRVTDMVHHPLRESENFNPVEQETDEQQVTLEADDDVQPVHVITDDDQGHVIDADMVTTDGTGADSEEVEVVEEPNVAVCREQSMIPCEFCLDLFDEQVIAEHQDVCYRQQTSALQALLEAGGNDSTDAASRYRYPYSVMSLEERERFGQ